MARDYAVLTMKFVDGPRMGDTIRMPNPPPQYLKLAMPEWVVYECSGQTYTVLYEGLAARVWRNPDRPDFLVL